jgi:hypothetical protein
LLPTSRGGPGDHFRNLIEIGNHFILIENIGYTGNEISYGINYGHVLAPKPLSRLGLLVDPNIFRALRPEEKSSGDRP